MAGKIYSREMRSVMCEGGVIEYELIRKDVVNVNLCIDLSGNVKVSAANRVPISFIEGFIQRKERFVRESIEKVQQINQQKKEAQERPPLQYVDGETVRILGKPVAIQVTESAEEGVSFEGDYLYFRVNTSADTQHKELLYEEWRKAYRSEVFEQVCHEVHARFVRYGVDYPVVKIRDMTSRWGSCQPYKGSITLNGRLIEAPLPCIEYVATHEFAHFVYPNHSQDFHALMTKLMPDWKQRKDLLRSVMPY